MWELLLFTSRTVLPVVCECKYFNHNYFLLQQNATTPSQKGSALLCAAGRGSSVAVRGENTNLAKMARLDDRAGVCA